MESHQHILPQGEEAIGLLKQFQTSLDSRSPPSFWKRIIGFPAPDAMSSFIRTLGPLGGFWGAQETLLNEGVVVWGALVQANYALLSPGGSIRPASILVGVDDEFSGNPERLHAIARRMFSMKDTTPDDPELAHVAESVTDEYLTTLGEDLPDQMTDGLAVKHFSIFVSPQHLVGRRLAGRVFPVVYLEQTRFSMILASTHWPKEWLKYWIASAANDPSRGVPGSLTVNRCAVDEVKRVMKENQLPLHLTLVRIGLSTSGYHFGFDGQNKNRNDEVVQHFGVNFVIDRSTLKKTGGLLIEFYDDGEQTGFTFDSLAE